MATIKIVKSDLSKSGEKAQDERIEFLQEFIDNNGMSASFNQIFNHKRVSSDEIPHNSLFIQNLISNNSEHISINREINISPAGWECEDESIFETIFDPTARIGEGGSSVIRFMHGAKFLADFYIAKKSLNCCDLTHHKCGFPLLLSILAYLVEGGHITEMSKGEKKKEKEDGPVWDMRFGADPEFEIIVNGDVVAANSRRTSSHEHSHSSEIGIDGGGAQLEFRPKPANDENGLVKNMTTLFEKTENLFISSLGNKLALGGHIHIGLKDKGGKYTLTEKGYQKLSMGLDFYLGKLSQLANGSARAQYAGATQYRVQSHGLEYRSTPAALFTSPEICRISVKICRLVAEKMLIGGEGIEGDKQATLKDLVKLGLTVDEAIKFIKFNKRFTRMLSYNDNIVNFWLEKEFEDELLKFKTKVIPIRFMFAGIWDDKVKKTLRDKIERLVYARNVGFYGLMASRGQVFSGLISAPSGYELIKFDYYDQWYSEYYWIGFPYKVRTGKEPINLSIINAVTKTLRAVNSGKLSPQQREG